MVASLEVAASGVTTAGGERGALPAVPAGAKTPDVTTALALPSALTYFFTGYG